MRSTRVFIHTDNFRHNLDVIKNHCPGSKICLAVKANAYGHGAVEMARLALASGVGALGVATVDEGLELRRAGIEAPVILYGIAAWPELDAALGNAIELFCTDREQLEAIAAGARRTGVRARVHLKVDTGMGRIGCRPDEALPLAELIRAQGSELVQLAGICTHFPVSESTDQSYTSRQIERFTAIIGSLRAAGIPPGLVHASNSGGLGLFAQAHLDMVRPGIMAYGYPPGDSGFAHLDLRPVMELRTAISFIKQVEADTPLSYGHRYRTPVASLIATLPVGYADGLPRLASGKLGFVEAAAGPKARRFPQVGTICMDQCLVNLGPVAAAPNDRTPPARWSELVVFGPQPGAETAATIAGAIGSIPYEICCGISQRVPRVYVD